MAKSKSRSEVIGYSVLGTLVLAGTIALMLFGAVPRSMTDVYALLAGLSVSIYVFRFGLPWNWLYFPFLVSFLAVGMLLGQPGLMWMGGFIAGSNLGAAWRIATAKPKVKSNWTVNGQGIDTEDKARKIANNVLETLNGEKSHRLVVEYGSARFEIAGALPSKLVCHRNHDVDTDISWAVLSWEGRPTGNSVKVPMGSIHGWIPSEFVHDVEHAKNALNDFFKNPEAKKLGPEWNTTNTGFDLRLSARQQEGRLEITSGSDLQPFSLPKWFSCPYFCSRL